MDDIFGEFTVISFLEFRHNYLEQGPLKDARASHVNRVADIFSCFISMSFARFDYFMARYFCIIRSVAHDIHQYQMYHPMSVMSVTGYSIADLIQHQKSTTAVRKWLRRLDSLRAATCFDQQIERLRVHQHFPDRPSSRSTSSARYNFISG